jgi:hypothetical protein
MLISRHNDAWSHGVSHFGNATQTVYLMPITVTVITGCAWLLQQQPRLASASLAARHRVCYITALHSLALSHCSRRPALTTAFWSCVFV